MEWKELSNTACNLLEQVDMARKDIEYKIGDTIYNNTQIVTKDVIEEILKYQQYALNSKDKQCYSAIFDGEILKVKYLADGFE